MMRPRSAKVGGVSGWGYDRPTWDLYAEYETGDPRRDWTILQQLPSEVENETAEVQYANYFTTENINRSSILHRQRLLRRACVSTSRSSDIHLVPA